MTPSVRNAGRSVIVNFVVFQLAWFACVLAAARGWPWLGTACVAAVVVWHVRAAPSTLLEARLVGATLLFGVVFESLQATTHAVSYTFGTIDPRLPPQWLLAMWALFAITLNVSLRWLKRRWLVAAVLGGVGGPLAFAGGVRLGAATFIDRPRALWALAVGWAVAMPVLMWLSDRWDGFAALPENPAHD